eukprot:COSAG01_NODE_2100_length_8429_cov_29.066507_12_plen_162_part_00
MASFLAAVFTEIYLCNVCSCQEILRRGGHGQGEHLAGYLGARCHFELPSLTGDALWPQSQPCGHPTTQVVYALLSDILLGSTWQPELLAARQRLAWAAVVIPDITLPARLPLTVVLRVSGLVGSCASREVLAKARKAEATRLHRAGCHHRDISLVPGILLS